MILAADLRRRLQEERGIYVTEACDRCGQLLGPVWLYMERESKV